MNNENPRQVLENLLAKREENFKKAHYTINVNDLNEEELTEEEELEVEIMKTKGNTVSYTV